MYNQVLTKLTANQLHISHSQVWSYLNCSLKYYLQYVRGLPRERTSINLIYGSAVHKALERYYRDIMEKQKLPGLQLLLDIATEYIESDIKNSSIPVVYKSKDMPDKDAAIKACINMFNGLYDSLPLESGSIVSGVEVPLAAPMRDIHDNKVDMLLTGIIDLLILDKDMLPVIIDFKTAKQSKTQQASDEDLQMSMYAYLMAENNYIKPDQSITCRFQVFRKLKTPKLEIVDTIRTPAHRVRLIKIVNAVLSGIENQVFIPNKSWLCTDCPYADACKSW